MSWGGWGEGKKKARGRRWEGERDKARPRLPPFPSSNRPPRFVFLIIVNVEISSRSLCGESDLSNNIVG